MESPMKHLLRRSKSTKEIGDKFEGIAQKHLSSSGIKILQKNYLCKFGEIDIIGIDGEVVIFCEVRAKSNIEFGRPEETINQKKQLRIRKAASKFLQATPQYSNSLCRFDVISIIFNDQNLQINWIRNAF